MGLGKCALELTVHNSRSLSNTPEFPAQMVLNLLLRTMQATPEWSTFREKPG